MVRSYWNVLPQQLSRGVLGQGERERNLAAVFGLAKMAIADGREANRVGFGPRYESLKLFDEGLSGSVHGATAVSTTTAAATASSAALDVGRAFAETGSLRTGARRSGNTLAGFAVGCAGAVRTALDVGSSRAVPGLRLASVSAAGTC